MSSAKLDALINALRALPGIGPKSAQRMALRLLGQNRPLALRLAQALTDAVEHVRYCGRCRTLSDQSLCRICADPGRDASLLMVVESPADVLALEQGAGYRGLYFVLHGRLSPLEGIGPEQLRLAEFVARVQDEPLTEVILATNATVEGEATAHYLTELCRGLPLKLSRIGFGLPYGSEVEWADRGTLAHALSSRQVLL